MRITSGGVGGTERKRQVKEKDSGQSFLAVCWQMQCFFGGTNFNMFLCTSSLGSIAAYRLVISSDFDKLLKMF